jgi:hypothetical protein
MNFFDKKIFFLIVTAILFCTCVNDNGRRTSGIATVKGRFVNYAEKYPMTVCITVMDLVCGHDIEYEMPVKSDGTFFFNIPVVYPALGRITTEIYDGIVGLKPDKETNLEIFLTAKNEKQPETNTNDIKITSDDWMNMMDGVNVEVFMAIEELFP